jgi:hypothetical protein
MKDAHIAARVADIAHADDSQRQGELDELVAALKRLMIDTMARKNDFAALRAIDMIARLRGLVPTTARRGDGLEAALEEMRRQKDEAEDPEPEPPSTPDTVFDPPMPPELPPPVEPAPEPPRHRSRRAMPPPRRPAPRFAAASSATSTCWPITPNFPARSGT